jgi:Protein of unknown function (DUF2905)
VTAVQASFGKGLILIGLLIAAVGVLFLFSEKIGWIGRLPGDITIRRENFTIHFPLATCLIISALLSLLIWLFRK